MMDNLDYDQHYEDYARRFGVADPKSERYASQRAQQSHILYVHDALRDEFAANVAFAHGLSYAQARHFALYGVGRRFGILWSAFRSTLDAVPVDRTRPLTDDEGRAISRDLNTIYINIVGAIDNYAWVLRHERGSPDIRKLAPNRVGLFVKEFRKDPYFGSLTQKLNPFIDWFTDLRSRIPLYVPPTALDAAALQRYQEIGSTITSLGPLQEFSRIDELRIEQERLGVLVPIFMHHPDEPRLPFYPTVPQDLAQLVRISSAVRQFIEATSAGAVPP